MFEAGYTIVVISWENDGDNYKTETISGLSEEDVRFYKFILSHFKSDGHHNRTAENFFLVANDTDPNPTKGFRDLYLRAIELFPNTSDKVKKYEGNIPSDEACESYDTYYMTPWDKRQSSYPDADAGNFNHYFLKMVYSMLSDPSEDCDDFHNFVRVFESIKVFYLETSGIDKTLEFN